MPVPPVVPVADPVSPADEQPADINPTEQPTVPPAPQSEDSVEPSSGFAPTAEPTKTEPQEAPAPVNEEVSQE